MPAHESQATIDAIAALAEEIARASPESANKAMQIMDLVKTLGGKPDYMAIEDAIDAGTTGALSDSAVRSASLEGLQDGARRTLGREGLVVLFSALASAAVWRQITPGVPPPRPDVRRIPPHILMTVNGVLALVALSALLSIWFGRTGGH